MAEKVLFAWSGGKDSARALYELQKSGEFEVTALLTTVTEGYERISMHGVRLALLEAQAESLGFSLEKIFITKNASNEEYETKMQNTLVRCKNRGISAVVFGDIFLEDLRKYREENLSKLQMKGIFPIWKKETAYLAHSFVELGFKAVITCVDSHVLDRQFAGRDFDNEFIRDLPANIDPCGENGEFHSFVYDGPMFQKPVQFEKGEVILRDNRFYFCDLLPQNAAVA